MRLSALWVNLSAMQIDDPLCDSKTESCAPGLGRACRICSIEALEYSLLVSYCDSWPLIRDLEDDIPHIEMLRSPIQQETPCN